MLDKVLRPPKERLLVPAARLTQRIHPILLTLVAFGFGVLAVGAVLLHEPLLALGLWLANRVLDGLDGSAARFQARQSDFGGYLDILLDTVIYAALPIALVVAAPSPAAYLSVALLLAVYYLNGASWLYLAALLEKRQQGAGAQGEKTSITMPSGLIEGAETVVAYCVFLIWPGQMVLLFSVFAALVLVTVSQRLWWAARTLR